MKIMVVGGGGREHAIIKKIKENKDVTEIFALPGNGGMKKDATCIDIPATDIENIVKSQTNSQCLVTMSDNNIEVILPKESINESLIVKIKNIILSKTELSSEQISIIEI